jgi:hypothetical protein
MLERGKKHARQRQKLEEARAKDEERKRRIQAQLDDREHFILVVTDSRAQERGLRQLQADLSLEDKRQNVERIKRMNEFLRLQTLRKIERDDSRTAEIVSEKEHLLEERRLMAHENFQRKVWVKEAMDEMKVTNKFIDIEDVLRRKSGKKGRAGGGGEDFDDDQY